MSASDRNMPVAAKLDISKALSAFQADPQQVFESLQQRKDVQVKKLDDGGVEIILKPNPWTIWMMLALWLILSIALILMGIADDRDWFDMGIHFETSRMYMIGSIGLAGCFVLAVVRLAWGPPKPAIFRVHPGRLDIDYYSTGDHIVRKYYADDIVDMRVSDGLQIVARSSAVGIAPFGDHKKTLELIQQMIALTLWPK